MTLTEVFEHNLISPAQAIELVCSHVGTRFQARQLIADAIHSGDVIIYAESIYTVENALPTDEWEDLKKSAALYGEQVKVGAGIWDGSYLWPEETRYWDWDRGNFILNQSSDLSIALDGLLFEGVMLERKAVAAIVGQGARSGIGGRRSDRAKWADFWIAFIARLQDDPKKLASFKSKAELSTYMLEASDELFSSNGIKFAVDKVWARFIEPS